MLVTAVDGTPIIAEMASTAGMHQVRHIYNTLWRCHSCARPKGLFVSAGYKAVWALATVVAVKKMQCTSLSLGMAWQTFSLLRLGVLNQVLYHASQTLLSALSGLEAYCTILNMLVGTRFEQFVVCYCVLASLLCMAFYT